MCLYRYTYLYAYIYKHTYVHTVIEGREGSVEETQYTTTHMRPATTRYTWCSYVTNTNVSHIWTADGWVMFHTWICHTYETQMNEAWSIHTHTTHMKHRWMNRAIHTHVSHTWHHPSITHKMSTPVATRHELRRTRHVLYINLSHVSNTNTEQAATPQIWMYHTYITQFKTTCRKTPTNSRMRHVTHMNISHIWMSHVTYMNLSNVYL